MCQVRVICSWSHIDSPNIYRLVFCITVGRGSQSVQQLDTGWQVWGSNPGGGEIFRTCPDQPWDPPNLLYNGYRFFPEGKERPGRDAEPSPTSSVVVIKEQSYTSTPPMGRTVCTQPQCLYKDALYLTFTQKYGSVFLVLAHIIFYTYLAIVIYFNQQINSKGVLINVTDKGDQWRILHSHITVSVCKQHTYFNSDTNC